MPHTFTLRPPRIAIVGSGPSGCFLAGALRRASPEADITVLDRLPSPFGLVRYGVAADHQSTKAITRQFDRLFTREGIHFAGNVIVCDKSGPGAITLQELSARADAVVLATGLSADRSLGIPGDTLPGVVGAGVITRILNGHPDDTCRHRLLSELGERIAIVGFGNVAVDVVRLLTKDLDGFDGSDVNDVALGAYHRGPVREIHVYSRSPLTAVKCDAAMIKELTRIPGLRVTLHGDITEDATDGTPLDNQQAGRVQAIQDLAEATAHLTMPRTTLHLHFGSCPTAVFGSNEDPAGRVRAIRIASTHELLSYDAVTTTDVEVTAVVSAVGFDADDHSPLTATGTGSITQPDTESGRVRPGLYRVGWLRRGPRGTIPENRADALAVSREIIADLESGAIALEQLPEALLPEDVARSAVSYEHWQRIDQHELAGADDRRARNKVLSVEAMLNIAHGHP